MSACTCIHMAEGLIRDPACRAREHRQPEPGWGTTRLESED